MTQTKTKPMPSAKRPRVLKPKFVAGLDETASAKTTKLDLLIGLLRRSEGMTIAQAIVATSWQPHSIRGAMAGAIPKRIGTKVVSDASDGARVYRLP